MRDYMKRKKKIGLMLNPKKLAGDFLQGIATHRGLLIKSAVVVVAIPLVAMLFVNKNVNIADISDIESIQTADIPIAAASSKKSTISIPAGMVKANPFVPYRDISGTATVNDVPAFNLVEPPEIINENSDAARVMDTIVSGILFDKFSPSAILNIEGNDYLVKKGDIVNNYKVVAIAQDSVTVQLGSNVYKAGIGEILTEGNVNYNEVSNLKNKFGGVK